jgi:hypothetical protein
MLQVDPLKSEDTEIRKKRGREVFSRLDAVPKGLPPFRMIYPPALQTIEPMPVPLSLSRVPFNPCPFPTDAKNKAYLAEHTTILPLSPQILVEEKPLFKRPRIDQYLDSPEEPAESILVEEKEMIGDFKLPASKSPIMEAMVVCALNGWGIEIVTKNYESTTSTTTPAEIVFRVTDFNRYYKISRAICSKQRPTDDLGSRIKALKRWFVDFPKKKYCCNNSFFLMVKPKIVKKVLQIIERNSIYKDIGKN